MIKRIIRKLIPEPVLSAYHYVLARLAVILYQHPSNRLIVIGVTGTNGKSSTTEFIGRILEQSGHKIGWTSTAGFKIGNKEWENDQKMTMLGRFQTQKILSEMVQAGCEYAIIETSSQGILQSRHIGINYDVVVFTNLTPEHIEAHGSFENYKQAKGRLFEYAAASKRKEIRTKQIEKVSVVNVDDEHAAFFLNFALDRKIGFTLGEKGKQAERAFKDGFKALMATDLKVGSTGSTFSVEGVDFSLKPVGKFNVYNVMAAIGACRAVNLDWKKIRDGVASLKAVPGRMESIDIGQSFSVIVDYAYEPAALKAIYDTLTLFKGSKRLIHVLGSAGGGRDVARRAKLGQLAAQHDNFAIITNEDPYDEDPQQIIDDVAEAAIQAGMKENKNLYRVLDRQEAIDMAIAEAKEGDIVLITGKGSEPVMAVANGKKIFWDDREAARKALKK